MCRITYNVVICAHVRTIQMIIDIPVIFLCYKIFSIDLETQGTFIGKFILFIKILGQ